MNQVKSVERLTITQKPSRSPFPGRSKNGVNFDALDNQPVNLVMLFLVPQGQFQKHLHTLANIAKLLHKAEFRQALEQAPDADAMLQIVRSQGQK